ncbi:hypothetical protein BJ165DRAFT_1009464 [Panaeolus papilionaceus]|nr:hypothetical protein BJ165DRAFT_1009464 [Panaeolus papilionaceus]
MNVLMNKDPNLTATKAHQHLLKIKSNLRPLKIMGELYTLKINLRNVLIDIFWIGRAMMGVLIWMMRMCFEVVLSSRRCHCLSPLLVHRQHQCASSLDTVHVPCSPRLVISSASDSIPHTSLYTQPQHSLDSLTQYLPFLRPCSYHLPSEDAHATRPSPLDLVLSTYPSVSNASQCTTSSIVTRYITSHAHGRECDSDGTEQRGTVNN